MPFPVCQPSLSETSIKEPMSRRNIASPLTHEAEDQALLTVRVGDRKPLLAKNIQVTHASPGTPLGHVPVSPLPDSGLQRCVPGRPKGARPPGPHFRLHASPSTRTADPAGPLRAPERRRRMASQMSVKKSAQGPPARALPQRSPPFLLHPSPQGQGLPGPQTWWRKWRKGDLAAPAASHATVGGGTGQCAQLEGGTSPA